MIKIVWKNEEQVTKIWIFQKEAKFFECHFSFKVQKGEKLKRIKKY